KAIIAAVEAKGSKSSDVAKLVAQMNATTSALKPKATTGDADRIESSIKTGTKDTTSSIKTVQKSVDKLADQPTNITLNNTVTLDGKTIAEQISKHQVKK